MLEPTVPSGGEEHRVTLILGEELFLAFIYRKKKILLSGSSQNLEEFIQTDN